MSKKVALITGVTGQDGAYLAELLLSKGYDVHGIKRRSSLFNTQRIDHLYSDKHNQTIPLTLHYGDMSDSTSLIRVMQEVQPDEIYNLAAQSHVKVSWDCPEYTANSDGIGTLRILDGIRILGMEKKTKFYQASTSELYGKVQETPQSETTPFYPRSPYGVAKLYGYWITVNYRESYNMFASNGILFNHESPIRGETFVTRKITRAVASIVLGLQNKLYLGNLDSKRDWGHAKDYVEGMWRILQHKEADDFVLATGKTTTVRDFVDKSFKRAGIELEWQSTGIDEKGVVKNINKTAQDFVVEVTNNKKLLSDLKIKNDFIKKGDVLVEVDPQYFRPAEVDLLLGNPAKAKKLLNWEATKTLQDLVNDMVVCDLQNTIKDYYLKSKGCEIFNSCEM